MKKTITRILAAAALLAGFSSCVKDLMYDGPATIESVTVAPEAPTSSDAVTVTATVMGVQKITSVTLIYDAGNGAQNLDMTGSGKTYTATIPPMPDKTKVSYSVKVVNAAGAEAVSAPKDYTVGDPVLDYTVLVFNEVYGAGEDNEKFMELYNNGNVDLPLNGVTINKDEELTWTGTPGLVIPAKGHFLILGAKGTTPDGFSSGLSAKKSIILELFDKDGNKLDTFQRGEKGTAWGDQPLDNNKGSWSRCPDGTGDWFIVDTPTGGKANSDSGKKEDPALVIPGRPSKPEPEKPVIDYKNLVLNELYGAGEDNEKFIELYNKGEVELSLKGVTINKDEEVTWTGGDDLVIPAKGHFLILGAKGTTPDGFSSGLSAKKSLIVELFDAEGNKLDTFQRGEKGTAWGDQPLDNNKGSWSRCPDGTGDFFIVENPTGGKANDETGKKEDPALVK